MEARDERTAQVAIGWQAGRLAYQLVEGLRFVFFAQLPVDVSQAHGDLLPLNRGHQRAVAGQRFRLAQDRLGGVNPLQANKALRRIERRLRAHGIGHGRAERGQVVHLLIGQSRQVERARRLEVTAEQLQIAAALDVAHAAAVDQHRIGRVRLARGKGLLRQRAGGLVKQGNHGDVRPDSRRIDPKQGILPTPLAGALISQHDISTDGRHADHKRQHQDGDQRDQEPGRSFSGRGTALSRRRLNR